jgi:hypothetical protein
VLGFFEACVTKWVQVSAGELIEPSVLKGLLGETQGRQRDGSRLLRNLCYLRTSLVLRLPSVTMHTCRGANARPVSYTNAHPVPVGRSARLRQDLQKTGCISGDEAVQNVDPFGALLLVQSSLAQSSECSLLVVEGGKQEPLCRFEEGFRK